MPAFRFDCLSIAKISVSNVGEESASLYFNCNVAEQKIDGCTPTDPSLLADFCINAVSLNFVFETRAHRLLKNPAS